MNRTSSDPPPVAEADWLAQEQSLASPASPADALLAQAAPGGKVHATSLVAETAIGRRYLRVLHRAGEVAAPRTADELRAALGGVDLEVRGSMAYLTLERAD